MTAFASNPELIRNWRAQLRPGRMAAAAGICGALSLAIGFAMGHNPSGPKGEWGRDLLQLAMYTQVFVLLVGGGFACILSISREKEHNTFDFQRVTRLAPLELAVGKLFGAPALAYFVTLCLMPAALVGAFVGGVRPTLLIVAYGILLLGCIAAHAFALLLSLMQERGAHSAGALLFLVMCGFLSVPDWGSLGQLTPFFAPAVVQMPDWATEKMAYDGWRLIDTFFGFRIHHVLMLLFLWTTFTAWFLLALVRNIKRDPSVYELYSPEQALGLAAYVNILLAGFIQWQQLTPLDAQTVLLSVNLVLFFALGLILLRNRDRVRRRIRSMGGAASGWLAATWPGPYLLAGTSLIGLAVTAMIAWKGQTKGDWNVGLAVFRVAFISFWLLRDILFLQWMALTRVRRPLVMGFLYLFVFYICSGILIATLDWRAPAWLAFASNLVPFFVFGADSAKWSAEWLFWWTSLQLYPLVALLLVYLQRRKLLELGAPSSAAAAPAIAPPAAPAD